MTKTTAEFLIAAEAGTVLGVTGQRVRQFVKEGRLPAIRTPTGAYIFRRADVERLRRRREEDAERSRRERERRVATAESAQTI